VLDDADHPADYTGRHAFVFIDHVEPGKTAEQVVQALRERGKPPIMYASTFVGDYLAFAHVRVRNLAELQDLIAETIWEAGARCTWAIESKTMRKGAKRKSLGLIALTRIKMRQDADVEDARDRLAAMADNTDETGVVGASVITGPYDILLQMTGASIEDVRANIRAVLREIDGVKRTSTAFADGDRTEERYGEIRENAMPPDDEEP
jgi:DNA-binding Lrp family transcriptional regulator